MAVVYLLIVYRFSLALSTLDSILIILRTYDLICTYSYYYFFSTATATKINQFTGLITYTGYCENKYIAFLFCLFSSVLLSRAK